MKKIASLWILLLVLALVGSVYVGCRDDITVPFPATLVGDYEGLYSYTGHIGSSDDSTIERPITMRFTKNDYDMNVDSSKVVGDRVFCDVDGIYRLENGIYMDHPDSATYNGNVTNKTCTPEFNPYGYWSLDQSDPDTVRINQIGTDEDGFEFQKSFRLVLTE
ncbi:MAG: hypothetical protein KKA42_02840 [candidate division Zixibacteria bacterium]|nr:hypothetical protein [candidate division Zixibacteria bacterium]